MFEKIKLLFGKKREIIDSGQAGMTKAARNDVILASEARPESLLKLITGHQVLDYLNLNAPGLIGGKNNA